MKDQLILRTDYYYYKKGQIINIIKRHLANVECEIYGVIPEKGYQVSENGFQISFIKNDVFETIKKHFSIKKIAVLCEESQEVTKALRKKGHEAFSVDIQDCSGGHPEWHIKGDAIIEAYSGKYDAIIAHPPCTFMSRAGARWMYPTAGNLCYKRLEKALEAKEFFLKIMNAPCDVIVIENPTPLKVVELPVHTQSIQPYEYGHPFSKKTLLWIKGLPNLEPTEIISEYVPYLPSNTGGKKKGQKHHYTSISQKDSSKTFKGVADAMANQWFN